MVVHLAIDASVHEPQDALGPEVLQGVDRRDGEVSLLVPGAVTQVGSSVPARVPDALLRIDVVVSRVLVLVEADGVENEELQLRSEEGGVCDAGLLEIGLGLLTDVAWVPLETAPGHWICHIAHDAQGGDLANRVHDRGVRVWHEEHIALVDMGETTDAGPVEPVPISELFLVQFVRRNRHMLQYARQIDELEVHHLDRFGHLKDAIDLAGVAVRALLFVCHLLHHTLRPGTVLRERLAIS